MTTASPQGLKKAKSPSQKSVKSDSARQSVQVIARAGSILRTLLHYPNGLSLGEIAASVDLPRSTVQRIVDALDREALVIAASSARGVRLGPALIALGAATRFEIVDSARQTLETLAKETEETVDLSIFDQDKAVFVDQVSGTHRLRAVSAVGIAFPLHCTANGKAILAAMPEANLEKLRGRLKLTRYTKNTIASWVELDRELAQIRQMRLAIDREEHSIGISAIGTSIRSAAGELASISIPVPTTRFTRNEGPLSKALLKHCDLLRKEIVWEPAKV